MVDNRAARTAQQKPKVKSKRSWIIKVLIGGVLIAIIAVLVWGA